MGVESAHKDTFEGGGKKVTIPKEQKEWNVKLTNNYSFRILMLFLCYTNQCHISGMTNLWHMVSATKIDINAAQHICRGISHHHAKGLDSIPEGRNYGILYSMIIQQDFGIWKILY